MRQIYIYVVCLIGLLCVCKFRCSIKWPKIEILVHFVSEFTTNDITFGLITEDVQKNVVHIDDEHIIVSSYKKRERGL